MFSSISYISTKGSVEYRWTLSKATQGIIPLYAIWTIPNFKESFGDSFESPEQKQFMFRTTHDRENKCTKIYFRSPTTISLESVKLKITNCLNYATLDKDKQPFARIERHILRANEWQLLTSMNIEECCVGNDKIKISMPAKTNLYLIFEFVIESQHRFNIITLESIFTEGTYSDVVMKSADGDEFKAHKVLLASQSAVLKANFDHNFTESATNIVESPLETAVLREMLLFIYTDRAKVDEMPEKLLVAADYYQLSRLKSLCEESLHKRLTVDNAVETLQLADSHSAGLLAELTLEYIKRNNERLKLITKTEGWKNFNSVELLKRIIE